MATPSLSQELMREAVEALALHGSQAAASRVLGIDRGTYRHRLAKAAAAGLVGGPPIPPGAVPPEGFVITRNSAEYDDAGKLRKQWIGTRTAPGEDYAVPAGHTVKGESALVTADGQVLAKWIKTREDGGGEGLVEGLKVAFAEYTGAAPVVAAPETSDADLLTVYPIADLHYGLHAWGAEVGADYDVKIASEIARTTLSGLIARAEPSETAVLLGLGDLFHMDDQKNVTPGSGHRLDADGRWSRVFDLGTKLVVEMVGLALRKHRNVHLALIPGNHDENAAICLRVALGLFFSNEPRVTVHSKPGLFWYFRHGKCLLGAAHGHTLKPDRMALTLATDCARDWGETVHRTFYFGHVHHESAKECGPVRVESFQTPAGRDAWAHGGGYRSGRSMCAITHHAEHGEIGRIRTNIVPPTLPATDKPRVRVQARSVG